MSKTSVAMTRDPEHFPEPHTADVHPDEVDNYTAAGWRPAAPADDSGEGKKASSKAKAATEAAAETNDAQ